MRSENRVREGRVGEKKKSGSSPLFLFPPPLDCRSVGCILPLHGLDLVPDRYSFPLQKKDPLQTAAQRRIHIDIVDHCARSEKHCLFLDQGAPTQLLRWIRDRRRCVDHCSYCLLFSSGSRTISTHNSRKTTTDSTEQTNKSDNKVVSCPCFLAVCTREGRAKAS